MAKQSTVEFSLVIDLMVYYSVVYLLWLYLVEVAQKIIEFDQ